MGALSSGLSDVTKKLLGEAKLLMMTGMPWKNGRASSCIQDVAADVQQDNMMSVEEEDAASSFPKKRENTSVLLLAYLHVEVDVLD
jgi:hypothetical protein